MWMLSTLSLCEFPFLLFLIDFFPRFLRFKSNLFSGFLSKVRAKILQNNMYFDAIHIYQRSKRNVPFPPVNLKIFPLEQFRGKNWRLPEFRHQNLFYRKPLDFKSVSVEFKKKESVPPFDMDTDLRGNGIPFNSLIHTHFISQVSAWQFMDGSQNENFIYNFRRSNFSMLLLLFCASVAVANHLRNGTKLRCKYTKIYHQRARMKYGRRVSCWGPTWKEQKMLLTIPQNFSYQVSFRLRLNYCFEYWFYQTKIWSKETVIASQQQQQKTFGISLQRMLLAIWLTNQRFVYVKCCFRFELDK